MVTVPLLLVCFANAIKMRSFVVVLVFHSQRTPQPWKLTTVLDLNQFGRRNVILSARFFLENMALMNSLKVLINLHRLYRIFTKKNQDQHQNRNQSENVKLLYVILYRATAMCVILTCTLASVLLMRYFAQIVCSKQNHA